MAGSLSPIGSKGQSQPFVPGFNPSLVERLVQASHGFDTTAADPERNCWLAVHEHVHGVLPSEYDIREVPEDLYLAVLAERRRQEGG